jgi:hypothetical protein
MGYQALKQEGCPRPASGIRSVGDRSGKGVRAPEEFSQLAGWQCMAVSLWSHQPWDPDSAFLGRV